MKKMFLCLLASMAILSCSKDDETNDPIIPDDELLNYQIESSEGSWFILERDGVRDTLKGNYVTPSGGQLLDQAFFRNINVSTPRGGFNFRVSFPSSMIGKYEEYYYSKHSLNTTRLPLEETKYIKNAYSELDFPSSNFFTSDNVSGSVDLKNDFEYKKEKYSIYGDVYIRVRGKDGFNYDLKGYFWKK